MRIDYRDNMHGHVCTLYTRAGVRNVGCCRQQYIVQGKNGHELKFEIYLFLNGFYKIESHLFAPLIHLPIYGSHIRHKIVSIFHYVFYTKTQAMCFLWSCFFQQRSHSHKASSGYSLAYICIFPICFYTIFLHVFYT